MSQSTDSGEDLPFCRELLSAPMAMPVTVVNATDKSFSNGFASASCGSLYCARKLLLCTPANCFKETLRDGSCHVQPCGSFTSASVSCSFVSAVSPVGRLASSTVVAVFTTTSHTAVSEPDFVVTVALILAAPLLRAVTTAVRGLIPFSATEATAGLSDAQVTDSMETSLGVTNNFNCWVSGIWETGAFCASRYRVQLLIFKVTPFS